MLLNTLFSGDGVLFPYDVPCVVAGKFDSSLVKFKATDLSTLDSVTVVNGGTNAASLFQIPGTTYFTVSQYTGAILFVNLLDFSEFYQNSAISDYMGAYPIDNTRAVAAADTAGGKLRIISFDKNNPKNCLLFVNGYNFECTSCNPGWYLAVDECFVCEATCLECSGPSNSECTKCGGVLYLDDSRCLPVCTLGKKIELAT